MVLLNLRFQTDTPTGMVDIHAFISDQEDGKFLIYCRRGNDQTSRVVDTFAMAVACLKSILDRIDTEVASLKRFREEVATS